MPSKILSTILMGTFLGFVLNTPSSPKNYHDPELKPYIEEFIRLSRMVSPAIEPRVKNMAITFGEVPADEYAYYSPYHNTIVVSKKPWNELKYNAEREELMFHELGHGALNLDHRSYGIMKAQGLLGHQDYTMNYRALINDLFDCRNKYCINEDYKNKYKGKQVTKQDLLDNEHAVVRFTATWCPPCKALAPVFDEVAAAHPNVKVYVVDVDENQDLARDMGIRGIPCMIAIRNKAVSDTKVGNQPKPEIEALFK